MTRLFNRSEDFVDEMIAGFVAANRRYVRAVSGGVVRSTKSPAGEVAVVIGGGSGHYPAFGGLVGQGLAHGAAMGNLFASPSTQQVRSVAKAAQRGGGVLLCYGNYAGDVLNFDSAQEQLRAEGIECETVTVTDDISSAAPSEKHRRRGIAGDLTVFKIAAAAAEAGHALSEVVRLARHANERTRSFGVAFTGCTLPGASAPLFTVPEGRMAIGLGIHGEPGIDESDVPSADELAELLVNGLLAELPDGIEQAAGARVVPILNGLGALKYEELFVVYRTVAELLENAGIEIVDPHVGEYCTSFDMAGGSLTLFWLDDELDSLWNAPADTPAYRRGSLLVPAEIEQFESVEQEVQFELLGGTDASQEAAATALAAIEAIAAVIEENAVELGRMDAVAGDGDHGIGMQRGSSAALAAARQAAGAGAGAGTVLDRAADAWSNRAGGTSGALWGVALRAVGAEFGDVDAPDCGRVAAAVEKAASGITEYGKAQLGDKTMVDALLPFAAALSVESQSGASLADAWVRAASVAHKEAAATADMLPRMGRARPHAEKSIGTPDPGAHSFALIVCAIGEVLVGSAGATEGERS